MKKRSATEKLGVGKRGGCSDTRVIWIEESYLL